MSDDSREPAGAGRALVASTSRWALCSGALAVAFVVAIEGYRGFAHVSRPLASFAWLIALFAVVETALVLAFLRAEESRLTRELRTARTGTAVLRGLVARRRQQTPLLARLFSTRLGLAAVLLADGDPEGANEVLAPGSSLMMRGGQLDRLRALVGADLERASGTTESLERSVAQLRALEPLGNREADLYRTHILVKALLQQGDAEGALEVFDALEESTDEEQHLYAAWLRVWFDFDAEDAVDRSSPGVARPWPPLDEGQLRLATLLARAHGAEKLVEKLEQRVGSIARPDHQG